MDIEFTPLDLISLIAILLFLIVIFLSHQKMKKKEKATLDQIDSILDQDDSEEMNKDEIKETRQYSDCLKV